MKILVTDPHTGHSTTNHSVFCFTVIRGPGAPRTVTFGQLVWKAEVRVVTVV